MKLLKDLGTFKNNTKSKSEKRGLFFCPGCSRVVEKRMDAGQKYKSCGCRRSKYGKKGNRLYQKWIGMKARCYYKGSSSYKHYGGRGITVCKEWENDFPTFYDWAVNNGWEKGLTIDRRNNDGNYTPNNCRFITDKENKQNTRRAKRWYIEGRVFNSLSEAAKTIGVSTTTIHEWCMGRSPERRNKVYPKNNCCAINLY